MAKKKDNTTFESEGNGKSKTSNRLPVAVIVPPQKNSEVDFNYFAIFLCNSFAALW